MLNFYLKQFLILRVFLAALSPKVNLLSHFSVHYNMPMLLVTPFHLIDTSAIWLRFFRLLKLGNWKRKCFSTKTQQIPIIVILDVTWKIGCSSKTVTCQMALSIRTYTYREVPTYVCNTLCPSFKFVLKLEPRVRCAVSKKKKKKKRLGNNNRSL